MMRVILREYETTIKFKSDAWGQPNKPQPLMISMTIELLNEPSLQSTCDQHDSLDGSVSYSTMKKQIQKSIDNWQQASGCIVGLTRYILAEALDCWSCRKLELCVSAPKGILRASGRVGSGWPSADPFSMTACRAGGLTCYCSSTTADGSTGIQTWLNVGSLRLNCIIGLNEPERHRKQEILLELGWFLPARGAEDDDHASLASLVDTLCTTVEQSDYKTVEALATTVAKKGVEHCRAAVRIAQGSISVRVEKPSAMATVGGAGVEVTMPYPHN